jgi:hypothetical protein
MTGVRFVRRAVEFLFSSPPRPDRFEGRLTSYSMGTGGSFGKGKVVPVIFFKLSTTPRRSTGEWRYNSTHFFTSALHGSEWSASRPGLFTPRYPLDWRLGGPQSCSLEVKRPGREGDHSSPSSAEVNAWSYTSTPNRSLQRGV